MIVAAAPKLRTVRLYGRLGTRFGRRYRLAVDSAAEAVAALGAQLPGFTEELMTSRERGQGYVVFAGRRNLGPEDLQAPVGDGDIRIAPVLVGAKSSWGQVILGAVLIVAAFWTAGWSTAAMGVFAKGVANIGLALVLGGVAQMLTPTPKGSPQDRPENTPSYAFAGPVNTQAQGNPVPLLYGELIVGSAVISAGIEARDEVYVPTGSAIGGGGLGSGGGGGGGSATWFAEALA